MKRRLDHQYGVGQCRPAKAGAPALRGDEGAIANFSAGLAQLLAGRGIGANPVLSGPIWTPLIPSTMPPDQVAEIG